MFKPIIHNLTKDDSYYKEVQYYNKIIANKNLKGTTLKEKIESEKLWLEECRKAFDHIKYLLNKNEE